MVDEVVQQLNASLAALVQVVAEFSATNPWCFDYHCAERCMEASKLFEEAVREGTIYAAEVVVGFKVGRFDDTDVIELGHMAVLVGSRTVFDWTARQYSPVSACPRICSLAEWRETWKELPA